MFDKKLLNIVKTNFKLDLYGTHGIYHWQRVYKNTQILANYYEVKSKVFEFFALFHDSKRKNEYNVSSAKWKYTKVQDKSAPKSNTKSQLVLWLKFSSPARFFSIPLHTLCK